VILICLLGKTILKQELRFVLGTNVVQPKIKQLQDIGLAENGKGELCQKVKKVILQNK